ncbi:MAG: hypothetical protein IH899_01780 [Planctomycetes bacterium]|nr:hypothetical protein [Planctomycetota bacterium]
MPPLLARVQCGVTRRTFTSRYDGKRLVLAELGNSRFMKYQNSSDQGATAGLPSSAS